MSKKSEAPKKLPLCNWRNYEHKEGYEDFTGQVSKTMPDQAYTVQEIFEKFKAGVRLPLERETYYSDTNDFDHPDGYEYIDIVDYYEQINKIPPKVVTKGGSKEPTKKQDEPQTIIDDK